MRKSKNKKPKGCLECGHCIYIGDGDYICDENNEVVVSDWEPTEDFYYCGGKRYSE